MLRISRKPSLCFIILVFLGLSSCKNKLKEEQNLTNEPTLFTLLTPEETGVSFQNILNEGLNTNILMYEYFYNGGGAAIGDLNSDGLDDIYFAGNMSKSKLYLNKGNMQFEDITDKAGIQEIELSWKTGVQDGCVCYPSPLNEVGGLDMKDNVRH